MALPFLAALLAVVVIGCAGFPAAAGGSLYARLGGLPQIRMIVDEALEHALPGPGALRDAAYAEALARRLCAATGGPCAPAAAHAPEGAGALTAAEFGALVGGLRAALERRVGEREKNELLRLMAPLRRELARAARRRRRLR
ncbi:MAG: hypothetical protein JNM90_19045 [Burkholderiales bacterium]|nr:hypothetical protein [Burkholderiales bacterium]